VSISNAFGLPHTEGSRARAAAAEHQRVGFPQSAAGPSSPIALSEAQMMASIAASAPLPPASRGPFLKACARELASLPESRRWLTASADRAYPARVLRNPSDLAPAMPRVSKWER
jgi:hypothetical protein